MVSLTIQHLDRDLNLAAEIAAMKREIEGSAARPAPAFGDRAFFLDIAGAGTQLHVIRGRDYVMVSVLGFGEGRAAADAAGRMAAIVLSRMPATSAPEAAAAH
jgi:hypothetical protein